MITAVVLVGVLLSTTLLAAAGIGDRDDSGGNHGTGGEMEMNSDDSGGDHGSDSDHGSSGSAGSGGDHSGGDHGSGGSHSSGG